MSLRMPVNYPLRLPIRCRCERFVDATGKDVRWSLCSWHEAKAQAAARDHHFHDPATCRQCAALQEKRDPGE